MPGFISAGEDFQFHARMCILRTQTKTVLPIKSKISMEHAPFFIPHLRDFPIAIMERHVE